MGGLELLTVMVNIDFALQQHHNPPAKRRVRDIRMAHDLFVCLGT